MGLLKGDTRSLENHSSYGDETEVRRTGLRILTLLKNGVYPGSKYSKVLNDYGLLGVVCSRVIVKLLLSAWMSGIVSLSLFLYAGHLT